LKGSSRDITFGYEAFYNIFSITRETLGWASEKMLREIFQEATIISPTDTEIEFSKKNIEVIVTPTFISMSDNLLTFRAFGDRIFRAQTVVQWNIVSPDGKDIYFNKIIGEGQQRISIGSQKRIVEERKLAYILSLEDQFKKAQEDIYSNAWWKNQWWKQGK